MPDVMLQQNNYGLHRTKSFKSYFDAKEFNTTELRA